MKKLCLLFVAVFALGIVSCSKDDDETPAALEGKWEIFQVGLVVNGQELVADYPHTPGCTKDFTEFLTGNVLKSHEFSSVTSGGSTACRENIDTGTYSRNGNSIIMTYTGDAPETGTIVQLDGSFLKIHTVNSGITAVAVYKRI